MARVNFSRKEWGEFLVDQRQNLDWTDEDPPLWHALHDATARTASDVLNRVNALIKGHGVEAIHVEGAHVDNYHFDIIATYVNMGDSYALTLVYDTDAGAFLLTGWADVLEAWEAEHPRTAECAHCGREYPIEQLTDDAVCQRCENNIVTTWKYGGHWGSPSLVTTLRSIEGDEIAVHLWDDANGKVELAFSVPMGDGTFSAKQIKGHTPSNPGPYLHSWPGLVDYFRQGGSSASVAYTTHDVTINRDVFDYLSIAMDEFLRHGGEAHPTFVKAPPLLFACSDFEIDWHEERGEAIVRVFTGQETEHVRAGNEPLEIWSARSPEIEELIEDGFLKWKNDATVREYLKQIGVCR